jgi:DNA polymerase-3 subunit epsilon
MVDGWQSLINPKVEFSRFNIRIHGITRDMVVDAPSWAEAYPKVDGLLSGAMVASHTNFDFTALANACSQCGFPRINYKKWIDTCWLARGAWPDLPNHKLVTLANHFGIEHKAHDALEDARAAGEVLTLAMNERCVTIEDFAELPGEFITTFTPRKRTGRVATPRVPRATPAKRVVQVAPRVEPAKTPAFAGIPQEAAFSAFLHRIGIR